MKQIGLRRRVIDWDDRTSGRLVYSGDVRLQGLLEGMILRSPYPHARIRRIDTHRARGLPGVHAVITAADFPPGTRYFHEGAQDRPPLADGIVRFVGQEVAAVAAETGRQSHAALEAIVVKYEPLAGPLTVEAALGNGAPKLHERPTGKANLSHRLKRDWGSCETGRSNASISVAGEFLFPRQMHACMEPNIAVARWDEEAQQLHFWTSTQSPYYVANEVARVLGLDQAQVICHEVGVGGGFGSKSKICDIEAIAGLLARKARRPVRIRLAREEEFETTKTRHAFTMALQLHADRSGRVRAIDGSVDVENGAYNHSGVSVMGAGIKGLGMLYRPDGLQIEGRLIDTALTPGGQFRGYGTVQTSFALESLMDELAQRLGLDPIELRLRNANQPGETTLVGGELRSARLVECLAVVRDAIGWEREKSERRPGRGVGVASAVHVSGSYTAPGANRSDAAIDVFPDSRIRVRFGGADAGTGQKTILAQVAAEELGVDFEAVEVLTMESDRTPFDMGAWSSRGTHFGGHAVRKAALATAERLKGLAASQLDDGELWLDGGAVCSKHGRIPIGQVAQLSNEARDGVLTTDASFVETAIVLADTETGRGNVSASYNFAAHAGVVEVDRRTGEVKVLDYVAAHDIGRAINPIATEGQAIGGAAMGIGAALGEEVIFEQGKMANPAYLHYALPRAGDVPRIRPILIEGGDPRGPYGAKAIGECSINPPPAVIANAVYDAIGVRIRELPITPDKIVNALAQRDGRRRSHAIWRRPTRWWIALVRWAYPRGLLRILHARTACFTSRVEPLPLDKVETPTTLAEARAALGSDAKLLGGGTDLLLLRRQGVIAPKRLISLARVAELQGIHTLPDGGIEIGAAVTLSALAEAMRGRVSMIADTAELIATPQVRELATVGGNLIQAKRCWFYRSGFGCYKRLGGLAPCYAVIGDHRFYHAAVDGHRCQATTPSDLATAFVALGASAIIVTAAAEREVPMDRFYVGPGETVLTDDEILRAIRLPADAAERFGYFRKIRLWEGDFAVVSLAMTTRPAANGSWHDTRMVFGGIAPTPWRALATEQHLNGRPATLESLRASIDRELDNAAHPLARNGWKLDAATGLAEHAFEAIERTRSGQAAMNEDKRG
jgi:CO/xanthine dehydrogenase Mo-binding subunit/CO/xanthine dehydrogenase FAD-binding subunit